MRTYLLGLIVSLTALARADPPVNAFCYNVMDEWAHSAESEAASTLLAHITLSDLKQLHSRKITRSFADRYLSWQSFNPVEIAWTNGFGRQNDLAGFQACVSEVIRSCVSVKKAGRCELDPKRQAVVAESNAQDYILPEILAEDLGLA